VRRNFDRGRAAGRKLICASSGQPFEPQNLRDE